MTYKLKLGLIGLFVMGIAVWFVLSRLYSQSIQKPEIIEKAIPKKYKDPSYCDQTVRCGIGTIRSGTHLRSECVNEYYAGEEVIGPYCECLDNKCVYAPVWISTNDPDHQFNKGEEIMFTFAMGAKPVYGSSGRWIIHRFVNGQWIKVFENDYDLTCSIIDKGFKAFWTSDHSGEYKIEFTFFTDPNCENPKTTERKFKIT